MWAESLVLDIYRQLIDATIYKESNSNDDKMYSSIATKWRRRTFQ